MEARSGCDVPPPDNHPERFRGFVGVLDHAFPSVDTVRFLVGPENPRSLRAVERIGGVPAGTRFERGHEAVGYRITRRAWSAFTARDARRRGNAEAPTAMRERAVEREAKPKHVVSSTREVFPWTNGRLIPMLFVRHVPASVAFYGKRGFAVETRHEEWGWAMLRLGECRLVVDQSIHVHPDGNRLWIGQSISRTA